MENKKTGAFVTNPEKAASRIAINGIMLASLFVILAILLDSNFKEISGPAIYQMVLAIPLLFVSSLAYAKIGYWKETKLWDKFGYFTNTIGNLFVINAIGLLVSENAKTLALLYFILMIVLMLIYSLINISYNPHLLKTKIFKFLFSTVILFLGGILPLIL